jgi:hypothetical protein
MGTAGALTAALRSHCASCPIGRLTDNVRTEKVDERALLAAIRQHRLLFLQKSGTPLIAGGQRGGARAGCTASESAKRLRGPNCFRH